MRLALVCLVACSGTPARSVELAPTGEIAFVGVTVVPMDRPGTLPDHTVVIRDGRITAVGPTSTTQTPGATVIDGRGKWLIPGLADMHVHTYDPLALALFVSMGVTTIRVLWGHPSVVGTRDAIARGEAAGDRLAPTIFTAGSIVDGKPPIWPGSTGVATADEAKAEVAKQHAAGFDFIKVYSLLPREAYDAIVVDAAKLRMPVIGHVPMQVGLGGVLAAKQQSIEHLEGYGTFVQRDDSPVKDAADFKTRMAAFKYEDPAKLADAIARTKAAGTWNCPTLIVIDRISKLDNPDMARPEFRFVPKGLIASWDPKKDFRFRSWTADDYKIAREGAVWRGALVRKLLDAGAGIVAGTDVGNPGLVPGFSLHQELEVLVGAKLTAFEALRAATTAPAEMLGVRDQGKVAVGTRADLVLLDADPLADIRNTQKIAGVMVRGRWLPAKDLVAERERIAAIYAGTASRLGPLPQEPLFLARFRGESERASGEQQIFVIRIPAPDAAGWRIYGETRNDFEADTRWEIEPGADGRGARVHVMSDGIDLTYTRYREKVRVAGSVGKTRIDRELAIADDEVLAGAPLAIDALAYRHYLPKLPVGERVTMKLAVLGVEPIKIDHMELVATRLSKSKFSIQAGFQALEIELDENGWLVGHGEFKRVP